MDTDLFRAIKSNLGGKANPTVSLFSSYTFHLRGESEWAEMKHKKRQLGILSQTFTLSLLILGHTYSDSLGLKA